MSKMPLIPKKTVQIILSTLSELQQFVTFQLVIIMGIPCHPDHFSLLPPRSQKENKTHGGPEVDHQLWSFSRLLVQQLESRTSTNQQMWFLDIILVGGWTNPTWKIWVKMGSSSPMFGMKIKKKLSCHHLVIGCFLVQQFLRKSAPATNPTSPNFPAFTKARFQKGSATGGLCGSTTFGSFG